MLNIFDGPNPELLGLKELEWTLNQLATEKKAEYKENTLFAAVYGAYLCLKNDIHTADKLKKHMMKYIPERRFLFVKSMLGDDFSLAVDLHESGKFNEESYLTYFKYCTIFDHGIREEHGTPYTVVTLAARTLDIKDSEKIADFGSGMCDFICQVSNTYEKAFYYGIDIHTTAVEIGSIRAELLAKNAEIVQGNLFEIDKKMKFDKIFSNYPFGVQMRFSKGQSEGLDELLKEIPELNKANASDWVFNAQIVKHLKKNGKAAVLMTNGSTWNSNVTKIREYFVENGYVEAVIALPGKLYPYTYINSDLVILSNNNKKVRMVDACEICEKGRRQTEFSEDNIEEIIRLLSEDGEKSIEVDIDVLRKNNYVLNPSRYLDAPIELENGVQFGSIIKRLTRGAQITAKELDSLVTEEDTGIKYLMLSDIQNGMISDHLKYLDDPDRRYYKYFIENKNLVLSKNGAPFKVAVAEVGEDEHIIGNGNLFIIELDETKANPYYIKAFFDSEIGSLSLQKIAVGAAIPNISAESLKNLIIPLPSMEKQERIAETYQAKVAEIKVLKLRLQKAQEAIKNIFEEVE